MQHVRHIGDFFRVACAIINAYRKPISMISATPEMAELMLERAKMPNVIQALVEEERLNRQRKDWLDLSSEYLPGFPKLTEEYLHELTLGVYQLKLAPSYTQDKIQNDSEYNFQIHLERPGLLRVKIKSRFSGSKERNLWIAYVDPGMGDDDDNEKLILGWYCDCKNGARTLGCCAHIASVLWFLGFARWNEKNHFPSNGLLYSIQDCASRQMPLVTDCNSITKPYRPVITQEIEELFIDLEPDADDNFIEAFDEETYEVYGLEFEPEVFDPTGYVHPKWNARINE
jgi:hypothetical protein